MPIVRLTLYLLDTSALTRLPKEILQAHNCCTSAYSVWEVLCHLDEKPEEPFPKRKGHLMKVKHVQVLDDPRAPVEIPLLPHDRALQNKVSDVELVTKMLDQLDRAASLEEFFATNIVDSNGDSRLIADIPKTTRETLAGREQEFLRLAQQIIDALKAGDVKIETDEEYHAAILELVDGNIERLKQRGAIANNLSEIVQQSYYIHWSYIVHRTVEYFKQGITDPDPNDYEDAEICRHLWLDTPYCFVTTDGGLKGALEKTIALLNRLDLPGFQTTLQVIHGDKFR